MKLKMHLGAHAPNEGARQLARWIASECAGDLRAAARGLYITESVLQRILDGEITPSTTLGARMFTVFGAKARMFNRDASAPWFGPAPLARAA
ncbi:hypothetical protein K7957_05180 [Sphingomonas yunnanensis]|uniref:hypothetical protein n=1 Tax=Sphingomonas yunnanensis TaxID=310400 RepID=UPI001CA65F67|nr:hypothetical protein [Sphingomonas yunnanensis]MBY9062322.1 hypothetical protein [Sphingomonas yunnanensis]